MLTLLAAVLLQALATPTTATGSSTIAMQPDGGVGAIEPATDGPRRMAIAGAGPWRRSTVAELNRSTEPMTRTRPFVLSARVDYDADGHADTAYLVQNRRQYGVMVEHGGPRRRAPTLALRWIGQIGGGTQLRAAGPNRLELNEPDAAPIILLMHEGRPSMIFRGD